MNYFVDFACRSLNKVGEELCGDKVEIEKKKAGTTIVLADGLGSGVKANILVTLTSKLLCLMIANGADIVTDTNMALAGINKKVLARYGGVAHCFMADEEVARIAKSRQVTRATVSMEKAAQIQKPVIFAVGNAPTALVSLYELMQKSDWRPAFIIGVPVGFVNVEAAKELILETDVPHIVNRGRKGGSNVAAAIVNAILYELGR